MQRKLIGVAIACSLAALVVPAAFAGATTHGTTTYTNQIVTDPAGDICPFAITISFNATVTHPVLYHQRGRVIAVNYHVTQQTTYSANAKTLVGDWFTYEQISKYAYDSSGNWYQTSGVGTGQGEKVTLPDGSLFFSAGRIDYLSPTFINKYWINIVNSGTSGNVAGFCAALAP
jgi:hypothetical protein